MATKTLKINGNLSVQGGHTTSTTNVLDVSNGTAKLNKQGTTDSDNEILVRKDLNDLDVSFNNKLSASKTITQLSQNDGKISATASNIQISTSQVTDLNTTIDTINGRLDNLGFKKGECIVVSNINLQGVKTLTNASPKNTVYSPESQTNIDVTPGNYILKIGCYVMLHIELIGNTSTNIPVNTVFATIPQGFIPKESITVLGISEYYGLSQSATSGGNYNITSKFNIGNDGTIKCEDTVLKYYTSTIASGGGGKWSTTTTQTVYHYPNIVLNAFWNIA